MSAANKKHYEPLTWDGFFDELTYADDVLPVLFRAPPYSEPVMRGEFFSAFTEQATLP